ncbi:hypothetical protein GCM10010404_90590 [Nonomuraea africana]|uniref:SRPBCC family protein n=1 Tax=Nonomuraea africana TaxID=46171 RepID=A0ABR9KDE2_9ACTN|nr:hypothetical protein [Nonomuraea africana]MBE1560015.1 hypothetical protein [Nonomuraea africana]
MTNKKLIIEAAGGIEAPVAHVWNALADELLPGGRRTGRFTVEDFPGHTSTVEVAGHTISFQGGWWYRGEWSVEPHPKGALLVHRVFNVAQWARWGVPSAACALCVIDWLDTNDHEGPRLLSMHRGALS